MNREQAKKLLPLIKAYSEGRDIEFRTGKGEWCTAFMKYIDDLWQDNEKYRIKPEPVYRPFKNAEECWNEMKKHQPFGWVKRFGNYTQIITLDNNTVTLSNSIGKSSFLSYKDHRQIAFADGTPFGVKIKEK